MDSDDEMSLLPKPRSAGFYQKGVLAEEVDGLYQF